MTTADKKDDVMRIWRRCFDDSDAYIDMYFSKIYRDDDALTYESDGQAVASMMLQPYGMRFFGDESAPVGYISGAATLPGWRNRGYMSRLMSDALRLSRYRGYLFDLLIPADDRLYDYYRRFGFATVFMVDRRRYTSLHTFRPVGEYAPLTEFGDESYRFFREAMEDRRCCVLHDRRQYDGIVMDNAVDGGSMAGVADGSGRVCGLAFVVPRDSTAVVTDLLAVDGDGAEATLAEVRRQYPGQPIEVMAPPSADCRRNGRRGMARIVDAGAVMSAIASGCPELRYTVRLRDGLLPDNDGVYVVADGRCLRFATAPGRVDLDVGPDVLASVIFGNSVTADIFGFPSVRPFMSLMLD